MIRVLIVDDSATTREHLKWIFEQESGIQVVGAARDGLEAVELVKETQPDVVSMDICMPRMDGLEATKKIMEVHPVPIVIVSTTIDPEDVEKTFSALKSGAVSAIRKPQGPGSPGYKKDAAKLIQTMRLMSEVKVVRRRVKADRATAGAGAMRKAAAKSHQADVVVFGSSTGGSPVLHTILSNLKPDFPVPMLIVQHIAAGFIQGMADWLNKTTAFTVRLPKKDEPLEPGVVFVAPDEHHMGLTKSGRIVLSRQPPENGLRPSVSFLFRSVAEAFGKNAVGVLLTGMGRDGSVELKMMRDKGAITIAQDKETSVVHGMPGEAIKLGAAMHVLPPKSIASLLNDLISRKDG